MCWSCRRFWFRKGDGLSPCLPLPFHPGHRLCPRHPPPTSPGSQHTGLKAQPCSLREFDSYIGSTRTPTPAPPGSLSHAVSLLQVFLQGESSGGRADVGGKAPERRSDHPPVHRGQQLRADPETADAQVATSGWRTHISIFNKSSDINLCVSVDPWWRTTEWAPLNQGSSLNWTSQ